MKKRDLVILAAALLFALLAGFWVLHSDVLQTGSWGLSFREPGVPPVGNVGVDQLKRFDAAYLSNTQEKVIYLTFDAGYENGCTEPILDALKKHNAPAAFFLVGTYIRQHPDLVRRMAGEGHTVGNHTFSHPSLPECSPDELYNELSQLHEYILEKFDYEMYVMRPPMGEFSERVLKCAADMGYTTVLWSFAYPDWDVNNQPDKEAAFKKITGKTHNGAVYLLHAVSETNSAILGDVIDFWKDSGYSISPM